MPKENGVIDITNDVDGIDEIYRKVQEQYGAIDAIFKSDSQLRELLRKAYEKKLTPQQWLAELSLTNWWQQNAEDIQKVDFYRRQYEKLSSEGKDVSKTEYGLILRDTKDALETIAKQLGTRKISDEELTTLAKEFVDTAQTQNTNAMRKRLATYIKFGQAGASGTDKASGLSADNLSKLRETAKLNGIKNFDTRFASKIDGWLQDLATGESIETIKQQIRDVAATGMPDVIKAQLANGFDLDAIVDPYRRTMAEVLELPEDTIDLSDSALTAAFGEKPMNLFDYQKMLRQDDRWQYTQQARGEVANVALQVLRDFGFTG